MTVFFYSIKGGQGKTTHAVGYATHAGAVLLTNDIDTGTADIYEAALPAGRIVTLEPGQSVKDWATYFKGEPLVIDFGGFVESRVIEAAQMADVTIIPLSYQSTADLMPAVKTVTAIQPYCEHIAILINNTDASHISDLQGVLAVRFPKMPVFVVNHSRSSRRCAFSCAATVIIAAAPCWNSCKTSAATTCWGSRSTPGSPRWPSHAWSAPRCAARRADPQCAASISSNTRLAPGAGRTR